MTLLALRFESHNYTQLSDTQKSLAADYLKKKISPIPDAWQWQIFEVEPGIKLRTGVLDVDNAKGTVIVVPGFTGSIESLMYEITKLHAAGFRVAAIEYRGQGKSWRPLRNPEKAYVESYSELAQDLAKFTESINMSDQALFFYSISKGAHITMRMAAEHNLDIAAYALVTPMIQIHSGDMTHARLKTISGFFSGVGLGSIYAPGQTNWPSNALVFGKATPCNANPETAQTQSALFSSQEPLRVGGVTMRWLYETSVSSDLLLNPDYVANITAPVKIFTAGIDKLVNTEASNQFCSSLNQCDAVHYKDSRHCMTQEDFSRYDSVIAASIEHFRNQL